MLAKMVGARPVRNAVVPEKLEDRRLLSAFVVTNLNDSGAGSLRQAILDATANSGPDDITFADGLSGTILLTSGELQINDQMTITAAPGQQITIDPNYTSRIFNISSTANATIQHLTMRHGQGQPLSEGGGGIFNVGTLTLIDDVVTQCRGTPPNMGAGFGGGILSGFTFGSADTVLNLLRCTISDNAAGNSSVLQAPTISGEGGGIYMRGTLTVRDSTIVGNIAGAGGDGAVVAGTAFPAGDGGDGGGIYMLRGSCLIENSILSNNSAGTGGTGAYTNGAQAGNGAAGGRGGGIFLYSAFSPTGIVVNSTIADNAAGQGGAGGRGISASGNGGPGGDGGGIYGGSLVLLNDTIAGNKAGAGGLPGPTLTLPSAPFTIQGQPGPGGFDGGIVTSASIGNTIVALNVGPHPDAAGSFVSLGHNLIGVVDAQSTGWVASDQTGTAEAPLDPRLAPLADYGGPTRTVALLAGSPALDRGDNALLNPSGRPSITVDQRGFARIFNGTVDIGAYEAQPPAVAGDVNHDGQTNFADLLALAQSYAQNVPLWEKGDLTGDGQVQFNDLLILAQNYGRGTVPTAAAAPSLAANTVETTSLDSLLTRTSNRASRARRRPAGSSSRRA